MKEEEIAQLECLLTKLHSSDLIPPKTPIGIWRQLVSIIPTLAVEVLVTRTEKDFLLTYRRDEDWHGWHIPGGFLLARETIPRACLRVARRELGIAVKLERVQTLYVWKDHPFASAVSLICICSTKEKPRDGKFFRNLPSHTLPQHRRFIRAFLQGKELV